jgi:hypothetical protein
MMNKAIRTLRSKASKFAALAAVTVMTTAANAQVAAGGFDAAIDAVDLSGLAVKIAAASLLIIGVAIAFKGSTLGKRVVNKV